VRPDGGAADAAADAARHARLEAATHAVAGESWTWHSLRGEGWGLVVAHAPAPGWRWPFVHSSAGGARGPAGDARPARVVFSVGIPLGTTHSEPEALAAALSAGKDVQAEIAPPFALVVVDDVAGKAVVQQDWLGMARLFARETDGVLGLCTRPTLVPAADGGGTAPDVDAWAGYTVASAFRGADSPVAGVRLLDPGERVTLERPPGSRSWTVNREARFGLDDLVRTGLGARAAAGQASEGVEAVPSEITERAAAGMARVAASVARHYDGEVELGLSGGKDSRVITAALIAAGIRPVLRTNTTIPAEGETAALLVKRLRASRGLELDHRMNAADVSGAVVGRPLLERAERLRVRYDHQFPSTYLTRPAATTVPAVMRAPSFTGGGGEILTGYWYPRGDDAVRPGDAPDGPGLTRADMARHLVVTSAGFTRLPDLPRGLTTAHESHVESVVEHAAGLGLAGLDIADYAYLTERMRRLNSAAYEAGMALPFMAPEVVEAAFALTPAQKASSTLHRGIIGALTPEWADVAFVSGGAPPGRFARIWDGDGRATLELLVAGERGRLAALLGPDAVRTALAASAGPRPGGLERRLLEQFVTLVVADAAFGTGPALPSPPRPVQAARRPPRAAWLPRPLRSVARRGVHRWRSLQR
jgi:asparagine synthase (glutamine-hydrolysing)